MESIDRLRRYVSVSTGRWAGSAIDSLIDQVEREVERERTAAYNAGYDAGFVDDDYDADGTTAQHDDAMAERGWVRLPLDAEGVPIHIGDVMEFTYDPPQDQPLFEVSGFGAGGTLFYAARGEVAPRKTTNASVVRHHHALTVEDVLREFALACEDAGNAGHEVERIAAEYAARLRLAGDE